MLALSCNIGQDPKIIILEPQEFKTRVLNKDVQIIDVRTPEEYEQGHIIGAKNIDYLTKSFGEDLNVLNKAEPVYIYCRSGKRSKKSISDFKTQGFEEVYELDGGILNWRKEGFKTVN
jgi:rhodanese-related sulfurtransferase